MKNRIKVAVVAGLCAFSAQTVFAWQAQVANNVRIAKVYHNEGVKDRNLGNTNSALANFMVSLQNDSLFIPSHEGLQDILISLGKEDSIRAVYEGMVDRYPDNPVYIYLAARFLDADEAEAEYQRVVRFDSLFYWGYVGLGQNYITRGMFEEAARQCSTAIAINPVIPDAQLALGIALENLGDWRRARRQFEKALLINPKSVPDAYLNLAMLYIDLADTTNGLQQLRMYLDLVKQGSQAEFAQALADSIEASILRSEMMKKKNF